MYTYIATYIHIMYTLFTMYANLSTYQPTNCNHGRQHRPAKLGGHGDLTKKHYWTYFFMFDWGYDVEWWGSGIIASLARPGANQLCWGQHLMSWSRVYTCDLPKLKMKTPLRLTVKQTQAQNAHNTWKVAICHRVTNVQECEDRSGRIRVRIHGASKRIRSGNLIAGEESFETAFENSLQELSHDEVPAIATHYWTYIYTCISYHHSLIISYIYMYAYTHTYLL